VLSACPISRLPAAGPHRVGSAGFTLVEMMIVVTIIAIATMLGIPSYRAWVQNTQIYTAAESAANGLQKAKAEAVRQNRNVEFVLGASFPWKIQLPGNTLPCPIVPGTTLTTLLECSTTEGAKNVTATATPNGATTITFNDLGGIAANAPIAGVVPPSLTQVVFDSASSATLTGIRKLQVTIGLGGITRMCDPDLTLISSDPRRCN
jgi:type IV fimbrial biogenesis protein FimT